jgi:hypothetical protein
VEKARSERRERVTRERGREAMGVDWKGDGDLVLFWDSRGDFGVAYMMVKGEGDLSW